MTLSTKLFYIFLCGLLLLSIDGFSQRNLIRQGSGRLGGLKNMSGGGAGGQDSLTRRDKNEDSITIYFRYLDSTRNFKLDSSINDFTTRFPIPATSVYLGNTGTATRSILFDPSFQPGWDPGFHAFDVYKFTVEKARFFNTTRPYSELNYQLASRSEQMISILHTQNIKPNWNFSFNYRLVNAPGYFRNQKTNHNNYLLTSWYQGVKKRYNNFFILDGNKLQAGENGGIPGIEDALVNSDYKDRYRAPSRIGAATGNSVNFFNTDVGTGNRYSEFTALFRQQYDLGQKDSIVTDSTVIPLFYPRLRFEHTLSYSQRKYSFRDYAADSAYYFDYYGVDLNGSDTFQIKDTWKEVVNDFSIYTFPDAKNLQQYLKLGIAAQNLTLENIKIGKSHEYNIYGHAEYRNRTRDQKWDLEANGKFYFTGLNAGDYYAYGSLQRYLGKKKGYFQLGAENVNRTPSFIYDSRSSFYLRKTVENFNKENTVHLFASIYEPAVKLRLAGNYYLLTNYSYLTSYDSLSQESTLFNVLQVNAQKTLRLGKNWFWHADVYFQKVLGSAPVNLPLIFTRNRIGYEGNLGFKNLDIAFGTEVKYHTPYDADGYSPLLGRFQYQDTTQINNPMPDIALYVNFRIRGFKLYVRGENLNTAQVTSAYGFAFSNNNLAAPDYAYPGLVIRFGIFWSFVN